MKIDKGGIINDFIEPNRKQYLIPVYQRNYEWSREQCTKLFKDILIAHKKDRYHFTGSIVYAPLKTENKIEYYVVIDGQQRLTTIYILIKALIDMADTEAEKDALCSSVFNIDKFRRYGIDESSKLKLKPVKSDNQQLMLLMEDHVEQMAKDSGIYQNYVLFCELIQEALAADENMGVSNIYDGLEHLTCATIKLEEEDNPQEIFERINSTGVPLSLEDKIRNFVLMVDVDQDMLYEEYWLPAETAVGKENMTAFFLDFLNMKIDGFAREDKAYDVFKDVYENGKYTNQGMLYEIRHYANFYKAFLYGDADRYSARINALLADLQTLKQTTVFLFLFHVFDDYDTNVITGTELEKVLEFLRNYSIRRIICEVSSNSLRGLYKTLYARIFSRKENKEHYYDSIVSFFQQLTSRDALPSDEQFISALETNNLYRKNALCKYLLTAIENQGKEKLQTDCLTIEHILPQNTNLSTAWQEMLGDNWQADRDKYLHTLGNLTLTAYNSELGDKPFADKKNELDEVNTKVVILYMDVKTKDVWNAKAIRERAKRLSGIIVTLFPISQPSKVISFSDPRYQEYTCDDSGMATYKTPNYYILDGERVSCSTFADMLKGVVARLYVRNENIIEAMAKRNERPLEWSQSVLFSYDTNKVNRSNYKIPGTDIYENTGYSASHIMSIIRAMLDRYDIDHSDFVYSARPTKPSLKEKSE